MDLTDRYLTAIRRNLPASQADDIVAELRDTLLSQREEREETLGRALTRDEEEELLKAYGHPLVVAARYGKQQYLIGPAFYPFYIYTLRTVLLIVSAVMVTLAIAGAVFSEGDPGRIITRALSGLWTGGIITVGTITIIFAAFERYAPPKNFPQAWRPRDLPKTQEKAESRWSLVSNLTAGAVFILWWTGVIHFPHFNYGEHGEDISVLPAPVWQQYFWPILAITVLSMMSHAVILARPNWLAARSALNLAAGVAGLVVLGLLYRAGHWADVVGVGVPKATRAHVEYGVNIGARVTLIVIGVIWIFQALQEGWRVWKARQNG